MAGWHTLKMLWQAGISTVLSKIEMDALHSDKPADGKGIWLMEALHDWSLGAHPIVAEERRAA